MTVRTQQPAGATQPSAEELRALALRSHARLEEIRTHLARRLHDDLIQKMTVVSLELALLDGSMVGEKELLRGELQAKLKDISGIVKQMIAGLRQIQTELRPKVLDEFGLLAALKWESQQCQKTNGLSFTVAADPEDIPLAPEIPLELFRMFQEIVSNIVKHAKARQVMVQVKRKGPWVLLRVADDGQGIASEKLSDPKSLGLMELRERALAFGGRVDIQSTPGQGTSVTIKAPVSLAALQNQE